MDQARIRRPADWNTGNLSPSSAPPCGITPQELDSIRLYAGAPIPGRIERFYRLPNAYQTFNLLMMAGLEGERVRICLEGQEPDPVYIREWRRTLNVFADIFRAQCRYRALLTGEGRVLPPLFRADRRLNVEQLRTLGRTFAFTSISMGKCLPSFAAGKEEPALLEITLDGSCPCLDVAAVLGEGYLYAKEAELLLPPFLHAQVSGGTYFTPQQLLPYGLNPDVPVLSYQVRFGGFCSGGDGESPHALVQRLDQGQADAAAVLATICTRRSLDGLSDDALRRYALWKQSFSQLVWAYLRPIWAEAFQALGKG